MTVEPITARDYEALTGTPERARVQLTKTEIQETSEMLLYEELSRARIRELQAEIRAQRIGGSARAHRRWRRVASWAARRAERYQEQN
ncbi:MAG TPA: hypothetical protein VJX66_20560 [Amycolatopsis sp.]|nr:hypothetical protein [Amycolatopsis sp.]